MDTVSLKKSDSNYPSALKKHLGKDAPNAITAIGNLDILRHNSTAFFAQ
jgi:predicted Rossmann fold nucleotide-binding protein DprA/Smf involved in DNA uptake